MSKKKKTKRETPQIGDVHITSNYRLKGYNKKNNNGRMVTVSSKNKKSVNAIVSADKKATLKEGFVDIDKKSNKFLKKKSVISLEVHNEINSLKSEKNLGASKKRKIDISDRNVFSERKAKLHWKDKKRLKKALKSKA